MTRAAALAWTMVVVAAFLLATVVVVREQTRSINPDQPPLVAVLALALLLFANAVIGGTVAARQPRNPVGWLFLLIPLGVALGTSAGPYTTLGVPGAGYLSLIGSALWFGAIPVAFLLFPDGRLPSPRWRRVAWLPLLAFLQAVPFDILAAAHLEVLRLISYLVALAVAVAALIARFRSSEGVVRAQLEWIAYAGGLVAVSVLVLLLTLVSGHQQLANVAFFGFLIAFSLVPLAAGLAILRYHLYDIEIVIRRTIVYGTTSVALAIVFYSLVVFIQGALRLFTNGSELAVAVSTLASFALFQPLRARIQTGVDRRFYRSRYDAARTLDAFSVRLRDEVALDDVRRDLLDAASETVRPAHASVWLRERRASP
jgi:hypothetical protein